MSSRTNVPRSPASATSPKTSSRHSASSSLSPKPVSLIEMFASRPSSEIAASASRYARAIASASSGRAISSPSTSTVARMPSALSDATTRRASASVEPAMYGDATRRTTDRGTAGSTRTTARSNNLTDRGSYSRMKPWRAAETRATASGKRTRIASRSCIACASTAAGGRDLGERRLGQVHRRRQRQGRELLPLRLLDALRLLLGELAQPPHDLLGVAAEREEASAFHALQASPFGRAGAGIRPRRRARARPPPRPRSAARP